MSPLLHLGRRRLRSLMGLSLTLIAIAPLISAADEGEAANVENGTLIEPAAPRDVHASLVEPEEAAAPAAQISETEEATQPSSATEAIRERYPNRMVNIERHVVQDADGNYCNHGTWTQWDEQGRLIARGEYQDGKRQGKWFRWYLAGQAALFSEPALKGFERPFGTEAEFVAGELHGDWKVFDAKRRPICSWQFENGERQGRSLWYLPSGQLRQEVEFKHGQMHGDLRQTDSEGNLVVRERYIDGHRLAMEVKYHAANKKKSEGEMLFAATYSEVKYDWWTGNGEVIPPPKGEVNQRHGQWTWWYPNGQIQLQGRYEYDQPIGKFAWWYANGQRQLEGEYVGGQQHGKYVWWYETGQKQREGEYCVGVPTGNWMQWTAEGRIVQTEEYQAKVVDRPAPSQEAAPQPVVSQAKPSVQTGAKSAKGRVKR